MRPKWRIENGKLGKKDEKQRRLGLLYAGYFESLTKILFYNTFKGYFECLSKVSEEC